MYAVLKSFGLKGLNGFPVEVEADISGGMPALSIVGLPDSAVRESGDRVHAALKNLGFKWPDRRITINLAPADVRKTGPVYDLPLLLAVGVATRRAGVTLFAVILYFAAIFYGTYCFGKLRRAARAMGRGNLNAKVSPKLMTGAFLEFSEDLNALGDAALVAAQELKS